MFAAVLRSPHPHARLKSIDTSRTQVPLVLTGVDVTAEGLKPVPYDPYPRNPPDIHLPNLDGSESLIEQPFVLAVDTVRYVGEAVALVVGETAAQAKAAADAIVVEHEPLPPIGDIAVDARVGNPRATRAGFAEAPYVMRLETTIPRGTSDIPLASEVALLDWASKKLGGSLQWADQPLTYATGDITVEAELALAEDGNFIGLHASLTSNIGAYTASFVPLSRGTGLLTSVYDLPAAVRARGVLSNTVPTQKSREGGRPETLSVMERLIDMAAAEYGLDPIDMRRRNLIQKTPHRNTFGLTFDIGDYLSTFDAASAPVIEAHTRTGDAGWPVGTYPHGWERKTPR